MLAWNKTRARLGYRDNRNNQREEEAGKLTLLRSNLLVSVRMYCESGFQLTKVEIITTSIKRGSLSFFLRPSFLRFYGY